MKSSFTRRAASGAVVALAAATLSLGAASSAHAVGAGHDIEGTVTGVGGAPVNGACVDAYDASNGNYLDESCTGVDGTYFFDALGVSQVKLEFYDNTSFNFSDDTQYLDRWFGGSRYKGNATPIGFTAAADKVVDFTMTPAAVIAGSVTAEDGHVFTDGFDFNVVNGDLDSANYRSAYGPDGMSFRIAAEPGSYRVAGYGWDNATLTTPYTSYVSKWWMNGDTPAEATPIAVAAGQTASGINIRLTDKLVARQAPSISGVAAVGRPLTASPGTWSRNLNTEYSYTWMRGATVVGTGAAYTPTVADFGQRLNVVVRALNYENAGQAASAQTDMVRYPADARGRARALAGHKVRFAVALVSAKQRPVRGKVVVLRGTKVVHKAVKLVKGKAVITVSSQPKGRQTFTVLYKGNSLLTKATKNFTVRVH